MDYLTQEKKRPPLDGDEMELSVKLPPIRGATGTP